MPLRSLGDCVCKLIGHRRVGIDHHDLRDGQVLPLAARDPSVTCSDVYHALRGCHVAHDRQAGRHRGEGLVNGQGKGFHVVFRFNGAAGVAQLHPVINGASVSGISCVAPSQHMGQTGC